MFLKLFSISTGFCAIIIVLGIFVMQIMKSSPAFEISKEFAQNSELVKEKIGEVKSFGFLVFGENKESVGFAKFRYRAYGENGKKVWLNFELSREGSWKVDTLYFDQGRKIPD
jgi:hypothetical protein